MIRTRLPTQMLQLCLMYAIQVESFADEIIKCSVSAEQ